MGVDVLGGFEHQVLLALLRLGQEGYTVSVLGEMESLTGKTPTAAAVYTSLRRMEKRGFLESEIVPSPKGGRPIRVFSMLPEALDALRRSKAALERYWGGLAVLDNG